MLGVCGLVALVLIFAVLARGSGFMWSIAYSANYTAAQIDADMPLLADQTMPVDSGSHPLFPTPMQDMWWYALGNTLSRVRINAPKYRGIVRPMIRPIEQAANPSSRPIFEESWRYNRMYNMTEPIAVLVSNNAPTGGERNFVVATFGDGNRNVAQGDMYTARFTTTFTPIANAWSAASSIVFDDTLPQGQYEIQGAEQFAAGGVAARLIFLGPALPGIIPNVRPGILVPTVVGSQHSRYFRYGYLGPFGRFMNTALPTEEVLFTAATANPDGYLDLVKVS